MAQDKLRIAQFTTNYPYPNQFESTEDETLDGYVSSGAERVVQELSEAFVQEGHEVSVFTSAANCETVKEQQRGVSVHRSPRIGTIGTTTVAPTLLTDHIGYEFDIVHAHNSTPPGVIAGYLHASITDTPLVITHHGGEQSQDRGSIPRQMGIFVYNRVLLDQLFQRADAVVAPSTGYIEKSEFLSMADETVYPIPNGVDVEFFETGLSKTESKRRIGVDPNDFCVLYLGTHYQRKGVDVLLDAFTDFQSSSRDACLVLAGKGNLTESLKETAERRDISKNVLFPGYIPESKKPTYLRAADVFVLPSIPPGTEMFPLVILEAVASGTPVIASDFPTIRAIVEPYDVATLVEPDNRDVLTDSLEQLYANPEELTRMQSYTQEMARNHSWETIANRYLDLYHQLLR